MTNLELLKQALDNIIEVAMSILKKHDPGHNDPVNFNSLIEMF